MATYNEAEEKDAQQVAELYTISTAGVTYYMTSANRDVSHAGLTYSASPIQRGEVQRTAKLGVEQLNIAMYALNDEIRQYVASSPSSRLYLTIRRVHLDDVAQPSSEVFAGFVANAAFSGNTAQVVCVSVFAAMRFPVPAIYHQRVCNWNLYDLRCGISLTAASYHVVVTAEAGSEPHEIKASGIAGKPNNFFEGGFAELKPDAVDDGVIDGETRLIVKHTGDTVELQFPFTLEGDIVGRHIGVYAGCNKSWNTCKAKFSNGLNFGGFPFIPARNPSVVPPDQVVEA